jgi:hypothetical protein
VLVLQKYVVVGRIPVNRVERSDVRGTSPAVLIASESFLPFWYVPTSSAVPTTWPSMALRRSAFEGFPRSGRTVSSA